MSRPKSKTAPILVRGKKTSSTLLIEDDQKAVKKLMDDGGSREAVILRALIKLGLREMEKKKISTLELIRLGAY